MQFCARGYEEGNFQPLWKVKGFFDRTSWKVRVPDSVFLEKYEHRHVHMHLHIHIQIHAHKQDMDTYMHVRVRVCLCVFFVVWCRVMSCARCSLLVGWCGVVWCVVVDMSLSLSWWSLSSVPVIASLSVELDSAWNVL